jgi:hypothetical protein
MAEAGSSEAENPSTTLLWIDREGHRGSSDDRPVVLAHQPDVARRAVDLKPAPTARLRQDVHRSASVARRRPSALTPSRQPHLIAGPHARLHVGIGWRRNLRGSAAFGDIPLQACDTQAVG